MIQKEIELKPLTVNKAWRGGDRYRTKEYLQFEKDFMVLIGRHDMIKGDVEVIVEFYIKNDKATDVDNLNKTLLDCVVKAGLIEDDRKIRHLDVYKFHSKRERINIEINKI